MRKFTFALLVLAVAAFAPAPIMDTRQGVKPQAEHTQEQIAQEQRLQGKMGEVGSVPQDTEPNVPIYGSSSSEGSQALQSANEQDSAAQAQEAIRQASKDLKKGKSGFNWWFAVLAAAVGFGAIAGFRYWANKAIPVPNNYRRYTL